MEDDNIVLTCTSCSSNPDAVLEWYHDNQPIKDNLNSIMYTNGEFNGRKTTQNLSLVLSYHHHNNEFFCVAVNDEFDNSVSTSEPVKLNVYYTPIAVNKTRNEQSRANEGETGELRCQINSNPISTLQWFRPNGSVLTNNDKITISNSTHGTLHESIITITKTESDDYGNYTCFAESDFANTTFIVIFKGISSPYPVSGIELSPSHNTINVTWIPGFNGGESQSFYVEYWVSPNGEKQLTEETTSNKLTIDELLPLTEYNIIVVSKNIIGESRSQTQFIITQDDTVMVERRYENVAGDYSEIENKLGPETNADVAYESIEKIGSTNVSTTILTLH
ncbi:cell adhesion molecule 3-like [Saccoglossus kowalevskii]